MLWELVAISVMGLLLGLRFRVPALAAATAATAAVSVAVSLLAGRSIKAAVLSTLALLVALETAYLIGLLLSVSYSKLKPPHSKP